MYHDFTSIFFFKRCSFLLPPTPSPVSPSLTFSFPVLVSNVVLELFTT